MPEFTRDEMPTSISVRVRDIKFKLSRDVIATFFGISTPAQVSALTPYWQHNYDAVASTLCGKPMKWEKATLRQSDLTSEFRLLHLIFLQNIDQFEHKSEVTKDRGYWMEKISRGSNVDVNAIIFERILTSRFRSKACLPYGSLLTSLIQSQGVTPRNL